MLNNKKGLYLDIIKQKVPVYVLISGGIDSSAVLAYYLRLDYSVKALFIDYGQASIKQEFKAAKSISNYYRIPLLKLKAEFFRSFNEGEILGRNAFFIFAALLMNQQRPYMIAIGIHSGSPYYDCSVNFIKYVQAILDGYSCGSVKIISPFINWDKVMIWEFCKKFNVPIELTYSCERGESHPCMECLSCKEREALNAL